MLILAMDTYFHLQSKLCGAISDPVLNPGWAYFVNYTPHSEFVMKYVDEEEVCAIICLADMWLILLSD